MATQTIPFVLEVTQVLEEPFRGEITPPRLSVPAGTVATYQIGFVDLVGGFNAPITLALPNLPVGAVAAFDINPASVSDIVTLTIEGAPVGIYDLAVEETYDWVG